MKPLLILGKRKFEEKELIKAIKEKKVDYDTFNFRKESYPLDKETLYKRFGHYSVIFNFCRSHKKSLGLIELINNNLDVPTLNTANVEKNCWDKRISYSIFSESKIPFPSTRVSNSLASIKEALNHIGYPAVLKDPFGSRGNNLYLIQSYRDLINLLNENNSFYDKTLVVQEFINKPLRDIRCLVIDDKLIASMYRYSPNWKTNIAQGAKPVNFKADKELENIVINAAELLGGGVIFLDVLEDKKRGYLVCEAGGMSQFEGLMKCTGINVAAEIIQYGLNLRKDK